MDPDVYRHQLAKQKSVAPGVARQWTQVLDEYMIKRVRDLVEESPDAFDNQTKFILAYQFMSRNIPINIQTEKFTKFCAAIIISGKAEEFTKRFENLKKEQNVEEMFKYLYNMEESRVFTCNEIIKDVKSEKKSVLRRNEGNEFYKKKKIEEALVKYNLSAMAAPHPNEDEKIDNEEEKYKALSMSFANRSALLLELKEYDKCLRDIDRALTLGYPEDLKNKLLIRKAKALMAMNRNQEASVLIDECIKAMEGLTMTDSKNKVTSDHLHELKEKSIKSQGVKKTNNKKKVKEEYKIFNMRDLTTDELIFAYQCPSPPGITYGKHHKALPSFSSCLSLKHSDEKGRYVVANRNINPGEIVACEKAYTTCIDPLEPEMLASYCTYCTFHCAAPVPCTQCTRVIFCNEECRSKAWEEFHAVECPLLLTLNNVGFMQPFCLVLALRMLIKTPFNDLKKLIPKYKEETKKPRLMQGFNENLRYESTDYRTVYHLGLNIEERSTEHVAQMCGWVLLLTKLLIKSQIYFTNDSGKPVEPSEDDIYLVGSTLFRHILATRCNDKLLQETQIDVSKSFDGRNDPYEFLPVVQYGIGIFPTLGLFNSDCNPSLEAINYGNHLICLAVRFIPSGSEVSLRYLFPYHEDISKDNRKTNLYNKYLFYCKCEACEQDWVLRGAKRPDYVPNLRGPKSRICEHKCDHKVLVARMKQILQQDECVRMSRRAEPNYDHDPKDLKIIVQTIEFYDRYVQLPESIYCLSQSLLSDIYKKQAAVNYLRTGPYAPPVIPDLPRPIGLPKGPIKTHILGQGNNQNIFSRGSVEETMLNNLTSQK